MIIWGKQYGHIGEKNERIDEATIIMVIAFLTCISTPGDVNQPQLGTRKAKTMASVPRCYQKVT